MAAVAFAATLSWSCSQEQVSDNGPAEAQRSPVRAELVADVSIIQSGNIIKLGVWFDIDPGWHIHWQNPGESGEPTKIEFQLPDDFEPGPLQWPAPVRFVHPDGSIGFGYRDQVLLQTEVRSSNLDPDDDWRLAAEVSWLACERECVPGRSTVGLTLPYAISGTRLINYTNVPRFDEWARRVPVAHESPDGPFDAVATNNGVTLHWDSAPADVAWFPRDTAAVVDLADAKTAGRVTRFSFVPATSTDAQPASVDGVVAYTTHAGERRAAEVFVPFDRASQR